MKNGILSKKRCMKVFAFLVSALLFTTEFSPAMNVFASEPQVENTEVGTDEEETSVSEITIEEEETSVSEITIEQEVIEENLYNADAFVLSIDDGLYEEGNDTEIFEYSESVDDVEGGWSFDAETLTLTLNGFNGHYIKGSGEFTIVLCGENNLTIKDSNLVGIENNNSKLTITDDGDATTSNDVLNITYSGGSPCSMVAAGGAKASNPVCLDGGTLSLYGQSEQNITGLRYNYQINNSAKLSVQVSSLLSTAVGISGSIISYTDGDIAFSVNGFTGTNSYCIRNFSKYGSGNLYITANNANVTEANSHLYLYEGTKGRIEVSGYLRNLSIQEPHLWYCEGYDAFLKPFDGNVSDLDANVINNPVLYYEEKELEFLDSDYLNIPAMYVGDTLSKANVALEDLIYGGQGEFTYSAEGLPEGLSIVTSNNKTYITGKPIEAQAAADAIITVTDKVGNSDSITISVGEISWKNVVEDVILDKEEICLDQEMSTTLTVSYNPETVDSYDAYFETDEEFLDVTSAEYTASDKVRVATINALDKAGVTYIKAIAKAGGATAQIPVYVREKTPQAYVGRSAFLLEGLDANATYRINDTTYTSSSNGTIRILDTWCGQEISLVKLNAEEKCNSGTQLISIPDTLLSEDIAVEMNVPVVGDVPAKAEDIVIYDVKNVDTDITDVYVSVTDVTWSPVVEEAFLQAGTYTVNITLSTIGDMVFPQRVKVDMPSGISFGQTTVSADRKTMQITWMLDVKERTPQIDFYNEDYFDYSYKYEFLSGFEKDEIYKINGELCEPELIPFTDTYGIRTDLDWAGKRIEIIHVSSQGDRYNSVAQKFVIPTNILPKTMDMTLPNYGDGKPVITADDISIKSYLGEEELCGKYIEVYDFSIDKLIGKPDGKGGTYYTADEDFVFGETFEPGRYELFFMLRPVAPLTWTTMSDSYTSDGYYQRERIRIMSKVYSIGGGFGEIEEDYCDYYNIMEIHVKYPMPEGFLTEDGLYIAGLESDGVYAISGNIQSISYLPHVDSYGFKIPIQYAGQQIALVRYCKEDTRLNSEAQYFNVPNALVTGEFGITIPPLVAGEPAPMQSEVKFKYLSYEENFLNINFPVQELSYSPEIKEGAKAEPGTLYKTKIQIKTLNENLKFAASGLTVLINNEEVEFSLLEDGKVLEATFDQYLQECLPEGYVYENKYIAGLLPDRTYLIDDTEVQTSPIGESGLYGVKIQPDWREKTVSIKLLSDVHEKCNSDEQFLSIAGITMPNEILVVMPTPEYDKPVTGIADVRIYDRSDMTEITNEYIRCSILSWSPDVVDRFAPGVGYTAWLELETCNGLSFNDDTRIWLGDNQVNTEYKAENTRVQFGFTYPRTKIPGIWAKDIEPMQYTGKAIKPVIEVYFGDTLLTEKDYSVTYKNNTNAATADAVNNKGKSVAPTVVIKGKGNYTGTIEKTFTILPIDLDTYESDAQLQQILSIAPVYAKYTGKAIKGTPTVMLNGKKLAVSAKQYTLEYPDESEGAYVNVGTYDILLQGCGKNFIGSTTISETISAKLISKVSVKLDKQSYPYNEENGVTVPNSIIVKDGKEILTAEEDYIVSYMDNDHVGTASLIITGINDYSGTKTVKYKITGKKLSSAMVKMLTTSVTYSAEEISLTEAKDFEVYDGQNLLAEGEHYEISYKGNRMNAGTFSVIFTGINAYSGSVTKKYKIEKMSATEFSVVYDEEVPYTKGATTVEHVVSLPGHILTEGVDYTITYVNNKNVASADAKKAPYFYITGKGNFTGNTKSAPCKFSIVTGDLEAQVSIQVDDVVYKNKNKNYIPKVTLTDTVSGKKLAAKTDYNASLLYEIWDEESGAFIPFESTKVDASEKRVTMRVTVEGANNYSGEVSAEYGICPKNITSVKVEKIATQDYTGKTIEPVPVITVAVKNGKKTEYVPLEPENYRLEYANNINKGTATIYIYGQGDYAGVKKVTFKIGSFKLKW